jgi:hypothetical protein
MPSRMTRRKLASGSNATKGTEGGHGAGFLVDSTQTFEAPDPPITLPKLSNSRPMSKATNRSENLDFGSSQLHEKQQRVTFTKELDFFDDLLESVQQSSQSIRRRRSIAPLKPNQLYQRIQMELPESRALDENPIKFTQDKFAYSKSLAEDALNALGEISRSNSRAGRSPFEPELPPLDFSVSGGSGRWGTPEPDYLNKSSLGTGTNDVTARSLPIVSDTGFSSRGARREDKSAAPRLQPGRSSAPPRTPLLEDVGGVQEAEREILRLMMSGCAREAARACQAALERYGEIPSLLSTFRRLLQLLRSPPSSVPVKVSDSIHTRQHPRRGFQYARARHRMLPAAPVFPDMFSDFFRFR